MNTEKLDKIRDELAEKSIRPGRELLELHEADARVRHFKLGFNASTEHWRKIAGELETALIEIIDINHCDLEMDATWRERRAIKAIDEYRKIIGE